MNITINNFNTNRYNQTPCFKSSLRSVKNADGQVLWRNTTNFFRPDLPWREMIDYFVLKYSNIDKVRVLCYGCSDGSEPMSLAMLLMEKLGGEADKFFPIMAKDIDEDIIKSAKSGVINVEYQDKVVLDSLLNKNTSNYLELHKFPSTVSSLKVNVKPCLKDVIHYDVADIRDEVHSYHSE